MSAGNAVAEDVREEDRKRFEELCGDAEYVQLIPGKLLKKVIK